MDDHGTMPIMESIKKKSKLRQFNNLLTVLVIVLATYVIVAPFLPQLTFWVREESVVKVWASRSTEVHAQADSRVEENRLFIPKLGLSETIQEGGLEKLKNGVLRQKHTSTPDEGGNTVLIGHRFMYDVKGTFYHLDKVAVGDELFVHWNDKKYSYRVDDVFVVTPEEISVEGSTDQDILTLYTCTPLWTAKDRLVVRASLQGVSE